MTENEQHRQNSGEGISAEKGLKAFYEDYWFKKILEEETKAFWPVYSEEYSWWKMKNTIFKLIKDELQESGGSHFEILDIGCGNGRDVFMLNSLLKSFSPRFTAIDISPISIELANILKKMRGEDNCVFKVGNAEKLEFDNDSFDVVFCSELLEHLPKPERCLAEIHRVLKRGGTAVITTPNPKNMAKRFASKKQVQKISEEQEWCFQRHGNLASETGHISEKSCKEWRNLAVKAGFRIETVKRGSVLYGGPFFDRHPALFGLLLGFDSFLDLFHTYGLSWDIVMKLRKVTDQNLNAHI
jgi:ubiquinone/menaquinone biosynthesis C-methylase UbiE